MPKKSNNPLSRYTLSLLVCLAVHSIQATTHIEAGVTAWCKNSQHYCGSNCGHGFTTKQCVVEAGESYLRSLCDTFIAYSNCKQRAWDDCMDWAQSAVQNSVIGGIMGGISRIGGSIGRGTVIGGAVGAGGTYLGSVAFCLADADYRARKGECTKSRDNLHAGYKAIYDAWRLAILAGTTDLNQNGVCDYCENTWGN